MKCGGFASRHFCVSEAMKRQLHHWGIEAVVLYDQPHERFQPASLEQRHLLMKKLKPMFLSPVHINDFCTRLLEDLDPESTLQTMLTPQNGVQLSPDRPALIISSTSWTIDEDFSILLEAAEFYDEKWRDDKNHNRPKLVILVTGKGPMKEQYLEKMKKLEFKGVALRTSWLEPSDYPVLLGSADIGVSLHTSSSGLFVDFKDWSRIVFRCGFANESG